MDTVRLPADDAEVLALLGSKDPIVQYVIVGALILHHRWGPVLRALETGVIDPDLDMVPPGGRLIHGAAAMGHVALLRRLIRKHGMDPSRTDGRGCNALHIAISDRSDEACALFLIREVPGLDVEARTHEGLTPLMLAAVCGRSCWRRFVGGWRR